MSGREPLVALLLLGAGLALWAHHPSTPKPGVPGAAAHHPSTPKPGVPGTPAQAPDLPPGPVQAKARTACMECHDAGIIVQQRLSREAWTKEVDKMIRWGAVVAPEDRDAFIDYFATNFGTDKPPAAPEYGAGAKSRKPAADQR